MQVNVSVVANAWTRHSLVMRAVSAPPSGQKALGGRNWLFYGLASVGTVWVDLLELVPLPRDTNY